MYGLNFFVVGSMLSARGMMEYNHAVYYGRKSNVRLKGRSKPLAPSGPLRLPPAPSGSLRPPPTPSGPLRLLLHLETNPPGA
jgi:hypothetical protein